MKNALLRSLSLGTSALLVLALAGPALAYSGDAIGAPEIDPSLLGSGVALLVGGAMVVIERYRQRQR